MKLDPRRAPLLIVDDSEEDCQLGRLLFEGAGYSVATARDAREAKALIHEREFGLLLVDLRLPDADGLDLLAPARHKDPHAVAVILTGFSSAECAVSALKAGAYDFLTKPCPPEKLLAAVDRAAERYALSHALADRNRELELMNRTLDRRVRDATEEIFELNEKLKRYVAELVESNNSQTRALEELAHELKNPLAVIWGYSSFLLRSPIKDWSEEELKRSVSSMHRNARHLQSLIEELLDSARLASRKIVLSRESFPAHEAIREALEGLRLEAANKGVALEPDPIDERCLVHADRDRLRQILVNLVTNAVKFTPKGGRVGVGAVDAENGVLFTVEDNGVGIAPQDAEKIFERFYQVKDRASQAQNKGLGLGLNIVRGLVTLHHGRIWVESEPGKGARFKVLIPGSALEPAAAETASADDSSAVASPNSN